MCSSVLTNGLTVFVTIYICSAEPTLKAGYESLSSIALTGIALHYSVIFCSKSVRHNLLHSGKVVIDNSFLVLQFGLYEANGRIDPSIFSAMQNLI